VSFDFYHDPPPLDEPDDERPDCETPNCPGDGRMKYQEPTAIYVPNVCEQFTLIGSDTGEDCGTCHHLKACH
jgi:hypothetical protein